MKRLWIISTIFICISLSGCKQNNVATKSVEIEREIESIKGLGGGDGYFSLIGSIVKDSVNNVYILQGKEKKIIVTNKDLQLKHIIDFSEVNYLFTGQLLRISIFNNEIYIVDESMTIKCYNLTERNIRKIELHPGRIFVRPNSFEVNADGKIIMTFANLAFERMIPSEVSIPIGLVFASNGSLEREILVKRKDFKHKIIREDCAYVKSLNDKYIVTFYISRTMLVLDKEMNIITKSELMVNSHWQEPNEKKYNQLNMSNIQVYNGDLFQLMYRSKTDNCDKLIRYNNKYEPYEEILLNNATPYDLKSFVIINDMALFYEHYSGGSIAEYKLKNIK